VGLRQQLADPWVLLVAALATGAVVSVIFLVRRRGARLDPVAAADQPRLGAGSPAEGWLRRAERAVEGLRGAAARNRLATVDIAAVDAAAAGILDELRAVAAQLAAADAAAAEIDVARLQAERTELVRALFDTPDGPERKEHTRAARAAADQLAAYGRLREAGDVLSARLEATALGLEALTAPAPQGARHLTERLGGLRAGLVQSGALSRQALGGRSRA
jgi:hypothetical protein